MRAVTSWCVRTLSLAVLVVCGASVVDPSVALAATGDLLATVTVGAAADCSPGEGTSVTLVQGSKVGLPQYPLLLVTSCIASGNSGSAKAKRSTLYLIDPGALDPATQGTVVKTLQTRSGTSAFAPGAGWAQLALASDKGVLYGCGTDGSLYTIDFNALNTITDGTLAQQSKPAGITTCTGLAWDPSNNSVYLSTGTTVHHFTTAGAQLPGSPFLAPSGCTVNGLSVTGGVLMVSCDGSPIVHRRDKTSGAALGTDSSVTFAGTGLDGLACDPVSFGDAANNGSGKNNIDLMWSKSAVTDQVRAFRMPAGTCGLPATATVLEPARCSGTDLNADGSPKDSDGDGLWDCWERPGADGRPGIDFDNDGTRDLVLCVTVDTNGDGVPDTERCANPSVKDVFVEIDFMAETNGTKSHRPDPIALTSVVNAFAGAPVDQPSGIRLHLLVDERVPHNPALALEPCTAPASSTSADFDAIKAGSFGTATERPNVKALQAKQMAFRYMLFAHSLQGSGSSGCAEVVGDDGVVALGNFGVLDVANGEKVATTDQQAGTFMHELGHLLGLRHGGGDNVNCKPNYLSIMNYTRQFSDFITARPLTYSSALLNPLNESALDEQLGLSITSADRTVYSGGTFNTGIVTLVGPDINWDLDANNAETAAVQDVNKIVAAGCDGLDGTASLSVLQGYDDWAEIRYNARASLDFAGGTEERDKTSNEEQASFELRDRDPDGVPDGQACGNPLGRCFIDIMPNQDPNLVNLGKDANIAVAIVSTPDFDAPTRIPNALRSQLTLNEQPVKINNNGDGSCHVQDVSSVITVPDPETGQPVQVVSPTPDGLKDLVCQFPSITLPLGRNFAVIDGVQTLGSTTSFFRARDLVTVR